MNTLKQIEFEYWNSCKKFPLFNTPHEGYAVILEELDELWEQIKKVKYPVIDRECEAMRKEAIQVGAMAVKFIESLEHFKEWKG